jgi:hypothetical protein
VVLLTGIVPFQVGAHPDSEGQFEEGKYLLLAGMDHLEDICPYYHGDDL